MDLEKRHKIAIAKARAVWDDVKQSFENVPELAKLPDNEKIAYFYKQHKEFYNEFPIVIRYMVCLGQFRVRAFEKFLRFRELKIDDAEMKDPKFRKETVWVRQQAMYVKFLYEAYNSSCSISEANEVYEHAYASLQAEFDEFQKKIKDAKQIYQEKEMNSRLVKIKELSHVLEQKSDGVQIECLAELRDALQRAIFSKTEKRCADSVTTDEKKS